MMSPEFIQALSAARRRMTQNDWRQLTGTLAAMDASPNATSIRLVTIGLLSQDAAWILSEALNKHVNGKWSEIAVAMTAVDCLTGKSLALSEIIWSGPGNSRFPVRRIAHSDDFGQAIRNYRTAIR
jgi:hypothetical protein